MDAITLLKNDHRKVEALFERYRSAPREKRAVLAEITRALSAHMDAEEKELYPVLRTSIDDGPRLMNDAVSEHQEARALLADLAQASDGSFDMDAKVATLRRAIEHHVSDEEEEIFPKTRQTLPATRLAAIGARIEAAKRSARRSPPPSAARRSPGASLGGMVSAAADRVKDLLAPAERKSARSAPRGTSPRKTRRTAQTASRSRKTAPRAKKTTAKSAKPRARVRSRARSR
jgi:hemerythrin superfamily protein